MIEIFGNLWSQSDADAICITTNGFVKKDGSCVMGRGCAAEAVRRYPGIDFRLGALIKKSGNHVHVIGKHKNGKQSQVMFSYPVKHKWWEDADIKLIKRSAHELVKVVDELNYHMVVLPRPGCGCGKLGYFDTVKPILEPILDERFFIITYSRTFTKKKRSK